MTPAKVLTLAGALMAGAAPAMAGPCAPASLADYLSLSAGGCSIASITFSDFSFSSPTGFGAADISVQPDAVGNEVGLLFTAMGAGLTQRADVIKTGFAVTAPSAGITGANLAVVGLTSVGEQATTAGGDTSLLHVSSAAGELGIQTAAFPPTSSVDAVTNAVASARGGLASLLDFREGFVFNGAAVDPPEVSEPTTLGLLATALLGLSWWLRRRRHS